MVRTLEVRLNADKHKNGKYCKQRHFFSRKIDNERDVHYRNCQVSSYLMFGREYKKFTFFIGLTEKDPSF